MDDYMFKEYVSKSKTVVETTSYLEIFSYSDPSFNTVEEHPLTPDEFDNFLNQRGAFEPSRKIPDNVQQVAALRMILQLNAKQPDTFSPTYISLTQKQYTSMIETFRLPYRGIESISAVGPLFWSAFDQDEEQPHLQFIFRKSDVRKKRMTRGWELMLSHDINNAITTGFAKGTPSSDMVACIRHLKACSSQIAHPMLLPTIIFSHDMSAKTDIKQREARDWLRKLEHAVSMRTEIEENESYVVNGLVDFDLINRDLVECHSQVLWKRPRAYMIILEGFVEAMTAFEGALPQEKRERNSSKELRKLHASMLGRMEFYKRKLQGIDGYAFTTLQRLDIQRSALYNIIAQRESKLNFQMAADQRKLAHASKRDSGTQKTIALLGALFLPGAYLASVFSMTFFNFQGNSSNSSNASSPSDSSSGGSGGGDQPTVSSQFWIYWAVTIPVTGLVVLAWYVWEKRKAKRYEEEDVALEKGVEEMEMVIQKEMRKRTMSKSGTWDTSTWDTR